MNPNIQLLDVVALTAELPEKALLRGQVGTVVEALGPDAYEVEFTDDQGRTYAQAALSRNQLIVLHYRPELVARGSDVERNSAECRRAGRSCRMG